MAEQFDTIVIGASPAQKFLLDIEGATPKVKGYPPMPKEPGSGPPPGRS